MRGLGHWLALVILVTSLAPPPEKPPEGWEEEDIWTGSELYSRVWPAAVWWF